MKRDPSLVRLSRDHHRGLVLAMRIARDLPGASEEEAEAIYDDLQSFWQDGLLPHFRAECECLLARLVRQVALQDELITRTQADHLYMESLMVTLRDTQDPALRRDVVRELGARLQEHIRWEEAVLFQRTQELLMSAELAALGRELAERIPEFPASPIWPTRRASTRELGDS
jgi:hypothetical protein